MFYSNFPQTGINSNVLQNTSELITQTKRLPQVKLEDLPPGGLFPQDPNYEWWEDSEYEDSLDDASYWATKVLGRRLHKREFAIRTGDMPRDVRIVSSQREKTYWESAINCTPNNPFGKFIAHLDADGIHARVVIIAVMYLRKIHMRFMMKEVHCFVALNVSMSMNRN